MLPNCTREAAEARRLELQQRINRIQLEIWPETIVTLGASAGVSVFPDDGTTHEALIAEADRRMYQDKASRKKPRLAGVRRHPSDLAGCVTRRTGRYPRRRSSAHGHRA